PLLPVGQLGVDAAERNEEVRTVPLAGRRQARVHARDVAMEQAFKTARPGLGHSLVGQLGHELGGIIFRIAPKGPAEQVHVGIDHTVMPLDLRIGSSKRRWFPPMISLRADSGISAPITLPSCDAKLRPPTSLPYKTRSAPSSRTAISVK